MTDARAEERKQLSNAYLEMARIVNDETIPIGEKIKRAENLRAQTDVYRRQLIHDDGLYEWTHTVAGWSQTELDGLLVGEYLVGEKRVRVLPDGRLQFYAYINRNRS